MPIYKNNNNMLSNYFYQYFKSEPSNQLRTELRQPTLVKNDAYKNINSSSVQFTNKPHQQK